MNRNLGHILFILVLVFCTEKLQSQSWNTIVSAKEDFLPVLSGQSNWVYPLQNDVSNTVAPLFLKSISFTSHGTATISDHRILFKAEANYDGFGHVIYTACDQSGHCGIGEIILAITDPSRTGYSDTIKNSILNNGSFRFYLPEAGFVLRSKPSGSVLQSLDNYQYEYFSLATSGVTETLIFEKGNKRKTLILQHLAAPILNKYVLNDIIYLNKNTSKKFSVQTNDLNASQYQVATFTQPANGDLSQNLDGSFTYSTGSIDFEGVTKFEYTACKGAECEKASVYLYVSDFLPREDISPSIRIAQDHAQVIPYLLPLSDYKFNIISRPLHGTLDFYEGSYTVGLDCDKFSGSNFLIYTPYAGFSGPDNFTVNYCLNTGTKQCAPIQINLEVYTTNECVAVKDFCWPGDADQDGLVDLSDITIISRLLGTQGPARQETGISWKNYFSPDWNRNAGNINAKHADTDGNGLIESSDINAVLQNYYKSNSLLPQGIYLLEKVGTSINPVAQVIGPGEETELQIALGDGNFPLFNVEGINFDFEFNEALIDKNSIEISVDENSWLGFNNPILSASYVKQTGRISVNLSNTRGKVKSGGGKTIKIRTKGGPVTAQVEGFRFNKKTPLEFSIKNIQVFQGDGQTISLPPAKASIVFDYAKKAPSKAQFTVYPNPSSDWINISILDPHERINRVVLLSLDGKSVLDRHLIPVNHIQQRLQHLNKGIYILQLTTTAGVQTKKLEIL